jgi:hypothetical protein
MNIVNHIQVRREREPRTAPTIRAVRLERVLVGFEAAAELVDSTLFKTVRDLYGLTWRDVWTSERTD